MQEPRSGAVRLQASRGRSPWRQLVVDLKPSQGRRAHILIMSSDAQELAVRSQCSQCQRPNSSKWLNKHCIINKDGIVGSLGIEGVGAAARGAGALSHYIGTQLLQSDDLEGDERCRQVLEVGWGKQRAALEAGEANGVVQIAAVSKPIRGIPGRLTKSPAAKNRKSRYSLSPLDGNGIEFHCRSVSQGVIAVDLTFVPDAEAAAEGEEDFGAIAVYYAWEELPLPLSGIEYTRMLGILSGPATLEAERIWAPAQPLDENVMRTLCVSVQALSNSTLGYDMVGVPYYQNPYTTAFDIVKGTDWERDTHETPSEATLRSLMTPSDAYVDMVALHGPGGARGAAARPASSASPGAAGAAGAGAHKKDGGASKSGHKQKRRESIDNRKLFERDQHTDAARGHLGDTMLLREGRDRPLVPLLLIACMAAFVGVWHWQTVAKVYQSFCKSDADLSSSRRRSESTEAVALRAAMVDGVDSARLAKAINDAERKLECVDAAVVRRARTLLTERRRLEKVAEEKRKKAAARTRFNQEAAARIAVKKQEEQLAKEAKEKAERELAAKGGAPRRLVGASTHYEITEVVRPGGGGASTDGGGGDGRAEAEDEDLKLAIEKSLEIHKAEAARAAADREEKAVKASAAAAGRAGRRAEDERRVGTPRAPNGGRASHDGHAAAVAESQARTAHAKPAVPARTQPPQQLERRPATSANGRVAAPARPGVRAAPPPPPQQQQQQPQQQRWPVTSAEEKPLSPRTFLDADARGPVQRMHAMDRAGGVGVGGAFKSGGGNGKPFGVWNAAGSAVPEGHRPVAPSAPLNTNAPAYTRQAAAPGGFADLSPRSTTMPSPQRVSAPAAITPRASTMPAPAPKYGAAGFVGQPLKTGAADPFPQPAEPASGELSRLSSQSSSEMYNLRDARAGSADSLLEGILDLLPEDIKNDVGPVGSRARDRGAQRAVGDEAAASAARADGGQGDLFSWTNHFNSIFSGGISSMWGAPDSAPDAVVAPSRPSTDGVRGGANAPLGIGSGGAAASSLWGQGGNGATMGSSSDFQLGSSAAGYFDNAVSAYDGWGLREDSTSLSTETGSTLYGLLNVQDADTEFRGGGAGRWSRSSSNDDAGAR